MPFEEFPTSLWRHFSHNVICFPATFLLLASMSLFRLFCLIYNKKQQKFYYVHPLTYLRQKVVQSYNCNLQITVLHLHKVGKSSSMNWPANITRLLGVTRYGDFAVSVKNLIQQLYPCGHLFAQSQREKHQSKAWNLFKVNDKYIRKTSVSSVWCLYC